MRKKNCHEKKRPTLCFMSGNPSRSEELNLERRGKRAETIPLGTKERTASRGKGGEWRGDAKTGVKEMEAGG